MARTRIVDVLLNVALVGVGLLVLVLLYGLLTRTLSPRTTPTRDAVLASGETPGSDPIQVEVRNAAGADGIARETTAFLRARGFDVVEVGNASDAREQSAVVIRAGTETYAKRVAAALALPESRVENGGAVADYDPDVSVYLGADYATLAPFRETDPSD